MENNAYEVIQINGHTWRIEENGVRMFLFAGTDKAMLVDSGHGTYNLRAEVEKLTALPVMLVNTHADGDHINGNKQFEKTYMHPSEFDRYHQAIGRDAAAEPLWEGDIIDLGGLRFEAILIPGHTPGSIVLLDTDNRILIGGDSVQAGNIYMFGPGRNIDAYIHSMKKLSGMRGRFDTVYPSHGSFDLDAGIVDELIHGAEMIRVGKINGITPPREVPALLYEAGRVKFLYSK